MKIGRSSARTLSVAGFMLSLLLAMTAAGQADAAGTGLIFVSNEKSHTVSVLDPETYAVVAEIETSRRPRDMQFGKDSRLLYVAFVNAATREVEDYVLVGSRAWGAKLSRDESTLFVTNGLSDDVTVISMETRRPVTSIAVGRVPHSVVVDD